MEEYYKYVGDNMKHRVLWIKKLTGSILTCSLFALSLASCQTNSSPVVEPVSSTASILESISSVAPSSSETSRISSHSSEASSAESLEPVSQIEKEKNSRTLDVDLIYQEPELPTGCEITALAMAIKYAGHEVDKTTLAETYLPKSSKFYYVGDKRYGPDYRTTFVGNPFTKAGYVCGAPAIVTAANAYFEDVNSSQTAINLTGTTPEKLYDFVLNGTPVVVWITIDMVDRQTAGGWYIEGTDEYLEWSKMDHCAVLTGVTEEEVIINDPISGQKTYSKSRFESVLKQRGNQAVMIQS